MYKNKLTLQPFILLFIRLEYVFHIVKLRNDRNLQRVIVPEREVKTIMSKTADLTATI